MHNVIKNTTFCDQCRLAINLMRPAHLLKSYTETTHLLFPSPAVIELLQVAENFWVKTDKLLLNIVSIPQLEASVRVYVASTNCFPVCDNIEERLFKAFFRTRIHICLGKKKQLRTKNTTIKCGS